MMNEACVCFKLSSHENHNFKLYICCCICLLKIENEFTFGNASEYFEHSFASRILNIINNVRFIRAWPLCTFCGISRYWVNEWYREICSQIEILKENSYQIESNHFQIMCVLIILPNHNNRKQCLQPKQQQQRIWHVHSPKRHGNL